MSLIETLLRHPILYMFFMYYGFQWYSGVRARWSAMPLWQKALCLPGGAVFYVGDVLWNIPAGSLMYMDLPFVHGITFSQRTEYWTWQDAGWRTTKMGAFWKALLNWWCPGHIKEKPNAA